MQHKESILQKNCVRWFRLQYPKMYYNLFAVPNGGFRNPREAATMKQEGIVAGVSDLILLVPNSKYHALCIEMKYGKNKKSDKQTAFQNAVTPLGYKYIVVYTIDDFINEVNNYLTS